MSASSIKAQFRQKCSAKGCWTGTIQKTRLLFDFCCLGKYSNQKFVAYLFFPRNLFPYLEIDIYLEKKALPNPPAARPLTGACHRLSQFLPSSNFPNFQLTDDCQTLHSTHFLCLRLEREKKNEKNGTESRKHTLTHTHTQDKALVGPLPPTPPPPICFPLSMDGCW